MFRFDRKNHIYTLDGERLLSNTEVIDGIGTNYKHVDPAVLRAAAEIGTAVHKATHALDKRKSWRKHYGHLEGYVEGWQKFKKDFGFKPKLREHPCYDPLFKVGTCVDAWGDSILGPLTVEIKTINGKLSDAIGLQLAYQERALIASGKIRWAGKELTSTQARMAVNLIGDGTYARRQYKDPRDLRVWIAALTLFRWVASAR